MTNMDRLTTNAPGGRHRVGSLVICRLASIILLAFPFAAYAHPVPRSQYDRNLTIEWKADGVYVLYRVEIDQYTLLTTVGNPANGFSLDPSKRIGPQHVGDAYIDRMRKVLPDELQ